MRSSTRGPWHGIEAGHDGCSRMGWGSLDRAACQLESLREGLAAPVLKDWHEGR